MKRMKHIFFPLLLSLLLLLSTGITVFAEGDGNIDGGGGGMGEGTKTDVWRSEDGVRVTVVTTDGTVVSTPLDLTNWSISDNIINFGKVSKLEYTARNRAFSRRLLQLFHSRRSPSAYHQRRQNQSKH